METKKIYKVRNKITKEVTVFGAVSLFHAIEIIRTRDEFKYSYKDYSIKKL